MAPTGARRSTEEHVMTNPGQPGQPFPPQGAPQPGQPYPPQGGQPFPPQGGPQQGQPFPPQGAPGQYGAPGPFGGPGQPGPGAPAPAPKSGKGKKIGSIAGAVVLAGGIAAFRFIDFGAPEVGDCVQRAEGSDVETVSCDDSAAELRVVGVEEEELTESEYFADSDTCAGFASATDALWYGETGSEGTVYCLEPVA